MSYSWICLVVITAGRSNLLNQTISGMNQSFYIYFERRIILDDSRKSQVREKLVRDYPTNIPCVSNKLRRTLEFRDPSWSQFLAHVQLAAPELLPDYNTFLSGNGGKKCPAVEIVEGTGDCSDPCRIC